MTPGMTRMAVGFSLIPLLPALFFIIILLLDDLFSLDEDVCFSIAYGACAIVTISLWLLAWRRAVYWTRRRQGLTALLALAVFTSAFTPFAPDIHDVVDTVVKLWPVLMLAAWFTGTGLVWRLRPGESPRDSIAAQSLLNSLHSGNTDRTVIRGRPASLVLDATIPIPCGNCDYDLRGLREARCPECGWTTTLDALVRRGVAACLSASSD